MTGGSSLIPSFPFVERHNRLLISDLRAFGDSDWKRPSYCPGWTAAHVIGHMTLGAVFYAHVVRAGGEGILTPPFGAKDIPEFRALRASKMEELVALPGEARVDRFEEEAEALQTGFAAIPEADLLKNAWHPRCPTPIRYFPGQRFYELILHEWDIKNEPASSIIPEGLDHGIDILKERLPFFYNQSPDPALEGILRFETTGPAHTWDIEIRDQKAALRPIANGSADVKLSAPASDMILLASGRSGIGAKRSAGALQIEGDAAKAEAFMKILFNPF